MVIADKIRSLAPEADISEVMEAVEGLLDQSIAAEGYQHVYDSYYGENRSLYAVVT